MGADKRIPVTDAMWERLHELKDPGQTYDDLLDDMIDAYTGDRWQVNRAALIARAKELKEEESEELTALEDLD